MKDYYYLLGIKPEASADEIKKAYRKLSTKFHPDKNDGDEFFSERFKEIHEAWEILGDNDKRSDYDTKRFGGSKSTDTLIPKIDFFTANKTTYDLNEEITFSWVTSNADKIIISPFGSVAPYGTKTYRVKIINSNTLNFELTAENSSTREKVTSSLILTRKTANTNTNTSQRANTDTTKTFNLYDYIQENNSDINKILEKIAIVLAIFFCLKMCFPFIKECFSNSAYEPITIKALLNGMGGDWRLYEEWVYEPTSFVEINSLIGWIFKILFLIPFPILIGFLMAIGFMYWLLIIVWIVKYLVKFLGNTVGIIASIILIIWIISWFL